MPHGGSYRTHVSLLDSGSSQTRLTGHRVQFTRDLLEFFGVRFKIAPAPRETTEDEEDVPVDDSARSPGTGPVVVSCLGVGYSNVNKAMA